MVKHLLKCPGCKGYTMKEQCSCGTKTESCRPPKYSPEDKLAVYRRKAKGLMGTVENVYCKASTA